MTRPPDFDELLEGVESPEERDRLRRVHDLLVAAGPPPELSPALAGPPPTPAPEEEDHDVSWMPPRRLGAVLLVGAALLGGAFGLGYIAGDRGSSEAVPEPPAQQATRVIDLRPADQSNTAGATIRLGRKGADGNWDMAVTVRGLDHLEGGDYYTVSLLKRGRPVVTCGTFNVLPAGATTVEMVAAYDLKRFDGWAITLYDVQSRDERVLMTET